MHPIHSVEADGKKLDGTARHTLRSALGRLPPVDALWSLDDIGVAVEPAGSKRFRSGPGSAPALATVRGGRRARPQQESRLRT